MVTAISRRIILLRWSWVCFDVSRQNNYLCGTRIVVTNKRTWRYKCFLTFSINPVKVSVLIIQKPGNLHVDKALVESWYSRCSTFDDFCNVITLTFCYWNVLFFSQLSQVAAEIWWWVCLKWLFFFVGLGFDSMPPDKITLYVALVL